MAGEDETAENGVLIRVQQPAVAEHRAPDGLLLTTHELVPSDEPIISLALGETLTVRTKA